MKTFKYFSSTFTLIISSLIGSVLGTLTSLMVNCTLLEISMNNLFSIVSLILTYRWYQYFGMILIIVGSLILWRSLIKNSKENNENEIFRVRKPFSPLKQTKKNFFVILSILVILSGFTSFILDQSWFLLLNYLYKIPIYSLLGVSISFTLSFMVIDILNYVFTMIQNEYSKPVINSHNQVFIYFIISFDLNI